MTTAVGVMARAPSSVGKTRLAPHLSPSRLASLRAALLADTLLGIEPLPDVTIFLTPDDAEHDLAAIAPARIPCRPQGGGDLGARMLRAVRRLLDRADCQAAILVGSDVPLLSAVHVLEAAEMLQAHGGIVLGPADDGGYYLIGMTEARAELFDAIPWGTGSVLAETLRAAERIGVAARLLHRGYDVDTIEDLRRLERDLAAAPPTVCPAVRRWLSES
ncbi:MAG: uncharacterized protein JWL71_2619 [Acidobacteria bacterium]|nr:uncharacterized protein [Acidobacteriota bacterium]